MMDKLLNTEGEKISPTIQSLERSIYMCSHTDGCNSKNQVFFMRGLKNLHFGQNFWVDIFNIELLSRTMYVKK
jgi:hypothetical protein